MNFVKVTMELLMRKLLQDLRDKCAVLESVAYGMLADDLIAGVSFVFSGGKCLSLSVDEDIDQIVVGESGS